MRTFVSPIGYDTRRVTRPVINTGLAGNDTVILVRPREGSDTERATQAVADVRQMLQEIEPDATCEVTRISTEAFEETVRSCCAVLADITRDHQTIVSLGGGARDILLPLTVASLVYAQKIDTALFFSDLDNSVREWSLPTLTATIPNRAFDTFEQIQTNDDWISLSELDDLTELSKSTIIRHVNDLAESGVIETRTIDQSKQVRVAFSGELLWLAREF